VGNYGIFANIAVKKAIWFCGGDEPVCVADAIIRQNQETIGIVYQGYLVYRIRIGYSSVSQSRKLNNSMNCVIQFLRDHLSHLYKIGFNKY